MFSQIVLSNAKSFDPVDKGLRMGYYPYGKVVLSYTLLSKDFMLRHEWGHFCYFYLFDRSRLYKQNFGFGMYKYTIDKNEDLIMKQLQSEVFVFLMNDEIFPDEPFGGQEFIRGFMASRLLDHVTFGGAERTPELVNWYKDTEVSLRNKFKNLAIDWRDVSREAERSLR